MENVENKLIGEESKSHFKASASWMRAYAIIVLIFLGILALALIIIAASKDGKMVAELMQKSNNEMADVFVEIIGTVLFMGVLFVLIFGFAISKLLAAGNNFTAISYSSKREDVIKAFSNLKKFWMFYGITMIVMIVFIVYLVIKVFSVMQEVAAQH